MKSAACSVTEQSVLQSSSHAHYNGEPEGTWGGDRVLAINCKPLQPPAARSSTSEETRGEDGRMLTPDS